MTTCVCLNQYRTPTGAQYEIRNALSDGITVNGAFGVVSMFRSHYTTSPPIRYNTPMQNNLSNTAYINARLYLPKIGSQEKNSQS